MPTGIGGRFRARYDGSRRHYDVEGWYAAPQLFAMENDLDGLECGQTVHLLRLPFYFDITFDRDLSQVSEDARPQVSLRCTIFQRIGQVSGSAGVRRHVGNVLLLVDRYGSQQGILEC